PVTTPEERCVEAMARALSWEGGIGTETGARAALDALRALAHTAPADVAGALGMVQYDRTCRDDGAGGHWHFPTATPERPPAPAARQQVSGTYAAHLGRSGLAPLTRTAYARHVGRYLTWLADHPEHDQALSEAHARDFAVRDYRRSMKEARLAPATLNNALAGVADLYRAIGLGPARGVRREASPRLAPQSLDEAQLRALLRALEARERPRDSAVAALMGFAGLRVAEVADLEVEDLSITARTGKVVVWRGKGDAEREVPLPAEARVALSAWLAVRPTNLGPALFPGPSGGHLSTRALHRLVAGAGRAAGLELHPHALRHTYLTRLVRRGTDLVMVAELAGHRRLETTRRYTRPSAADEAAAVEDLAVDY
ncbi:MAG: tyrosine-type recombinase/integrase, partial [Acidimicrobiales bacterium]